MTTNDIKVSIVGSGNWGSAITKVIGNNVASKAGFDKDVRMYVYEEVVDGQKLSEVINNTHENIKYLPGIKLPTNVRAVTDIRETVRDADILVFVIPHQFVAGLCKEMKSAVKPSAVAVSLVKGLDKSRGSKLQTFSALISEVLHVPCHALMGANLPDGVARGHMCEATLGCDDEKWAPILKNLFVTDFFRVKPVKDTINVEMCGALKNIVACAAGFVDGMKYGDNTKAAVIRIGFMEMIRFCKQLDKDCETTTFFESCGVADLVTTCYGGRNRRLAELSVQSGKSMRQLEHEILNGQSLQGPLVAAEIYQFIKEKGLEHNYPLMVAVHKIIEQEKEPSHLIESIRHHPVHM